MPIAMATSELVLFDADTRLRKSFGGAVPSTLLGFPVSRADLSSEVPALSSLPAIPSFSQVWSQQASAAVATWQSWELPLPSSDSFWSSPVLGSIPETRLSLKWREEAGGSAPNFLALFATLPRTGAASQAVRHQLQSFLAWDSWLKRFGNQEDSEQLLVALSDLKSSSSTDFFPQRLARKFPLKLEAFGTSFSEMFPRGAPQSSWRRAYLRQWELYAEGLSLHRKIQGLQKANQTASASEFLLYRALTSSFPLLTLMAARNRTQQVLDPQALEAVYPLMALGAMVHEMFADLFLASRSLEHKGTSVSSLELFDDEWAVATHNTLLHLFKVEAERLLVQAKGAGLQQLEDLVDSVKVALHGVVMWYHCAPAVAAVFGPRNKDQDNLAELFTAQGSRSIGLQADVSIAIAGVVKAVDLFASLATAGMM